MRRIIAAVLWLACHALQAEDFSRWTPFLSGSLKVDSAGDHVDFRAANGRIWQRPVHPATANSL
ncbi:MAG: hypothetical protein ACKO2L_14890 [Planctomycetaceae bacterium]